MIKAAVARHMSSVEDYRQRLASLQGSWDTLSLLSHLSGDGADVAGTRQAFEALAADLVRNLAEETYRKSLLALKARGQIAIDVIVRNLFERTADIGFLATDDDIRDYALARRAGGARDAGADERLRRRFREYVAKYSVYHDVLLLAPDGEVWLRLDERASLARTTHPLLTQTLAARGGYLETFDKVDLLPDVERSLIYSFRVCTGSQTLGVLCLCFRFDDEVQGIFDELRDDSDWTVFCFLDAAGNVIASSDRWQVPLGAPMPLALEETGRLVRFGGREYLAISRRTQGYQGYLGPGWYGHAMLPIEHAFEHRSETLIQEGLLASLRDSETIFSDALRRIPQQADAIQRELNRAVWNGNVRLASRADSNGNFAKVLLREIGNAGRRTQDTFERSINDLRETVVSAILEDAQLLASLAVDVLDRNLYERANDCRWWALNATLIAHLAGGKGTSDDVSAILRHINSLYTVYHGIVLFDDRSRIVAVSNPRHAPLIGKPLAARWAAEALTLRDSQHYAVSAFEESALYEGKHTLVYAAGLRDDAGRNVGGIGIVFDAAPQFTAMLRDALPRTESGEVAQGCIGLFVDQVGRVVAATADYRPGEPSGLPLDLLAADGHATARIVDLRGIRYAVGVRRAAGYREYRGLGTIGVVMVPLGKQSAARDRGVATAKSQPLRRVTTGETLIDVATFHCGEQWLGLLRDHVVEAVDGTQLRPVPNAPLWHAGLLMHREAPITVVDLAKLLHGKSAAGARNVIVARAADSQQAIGLLVDDLAEIPEVPTSRILPVTELAQRAGGVVLDRAVQPDSADDPVLLILNVERLLVYTRAATANVVRNLRAAG